MTEKIVVMQNGNRKVELPVEEALKRLGFDPKECLGISIRVEKDHRALEASICGDYEYPGITVDGYDTDGEVIYLTTNELPNADHSAVNTYVFGGRADMESDSWIARVSHGPRAEDDDSRHILYIDHELAAIRSSDFSKPDCATEKQADAR